MYKRNVASKRPRRIAAHARPRNLGGRKKSNLEPRCSAGGALRLLKNFRVPEDSCLLLYVGRLAPEKNLSLLFQLLHHLGRNRQRDFRLLVAGDGIERPRWEKESSQRDPGRVCVLGHVKDRHMLADLYATADLFLHPNPHEPFGIAPLEAMASGLPLIAPNSGGIKSYAIAENAWLADSTVESFRSAIEDALANNDERKSKAKNAMAPAARFRWDRIATSCLDLYRELHDATKFERPFALPPDFLSTPASGFRASLFHGVSQTAERAFVAGSRLLAEFSPLGASKQQHRRRRSVT